MYSVHDPLARGLPHSDIHGSKPARGSPWLFAACHVLLRLLVPRHPPNALLMLTPHMHSNHPRSGPSHRPLQLSPSRPPQQAVMPMIATHEKVQRIARNSFSHLLNVFRRRPSHQTQESPRPTGQTNPGQTATPRKRTNLFTLTKNQPSRPARAWPYSQLTTQTETKLFPLSSRRMVEADGFEPTTPCLQSRCSPS